MKFSSTLLLSILAGLTLSVAPALALGVDDQQIAITPTAALIQPSGFHVPAFQDQPLRAELVDLDFHALSDPERSPFVVRCFDREFTVHRRSTHTTELGATVIVGSVEGYEMGRFVLAFKDLAAFGVLHLDFTNQAWEIYFNGTSNVITESLQKPLAGCSGVLLPEDLPLDLPQQQATGTTSAAPQAHQHGPACSHQHEPATQEPMTQQPQRKNTPLSVVRLGMLFTDQAIKTIGSAGMIPYAEYKIALNNAAMLDSGVRAGLVLGAAQAAGYSETTSFTTDLQRMANPGDNYMDTISSLRNSNKLDIVSLTRATSTQNACGLAYFKTMLNNAESSYALNVCAFGFGGICDIYTFAHEVGHNFGCDHDRANSSSAQPRITQNNYGYYEPTQHLFSTIMSYWCELEWCPRLGAFSTPNLTYQDYPIGTANANNVECINTSRESVASYYSTGGPYIERPYPYDMEVAAVVNSYREFTLNVRVYNFSQETRWVNGYLALEYGGSFFFAPSWQAWPQVFLSRELAANTDSGWELVWSAKVADMRLRQSYDLTFHSAMVDANTGELLGGLSTSRITLR